MWIPLLFKTVEQRWRMYKTISMDPSAEQYQPKTWEGIPDLQFILPKPPALQLYHRICFYWHSCYDREHSTCMCKVTLEKTGAQSMKYIHINSILPEEHISQPQEGVAKLQDFLGFHHQYKNLQASFALRMQWQVRDPQRLSHSSLTFSQHIPQPLRGQRTWFQNLFSRSTCP